jgi:hydrogenase/urease accessory protein HupE
MVIPGNVLAIVFGILLALLARLPLFGSLQGAERNWLFASLLILVALFPLVPSVFLPRGKRFEAALEDATARGEITPQLREQMADPVVRAAHLAEMVGVSLIVVLMVFKPF